MPVEELSSDMYFIQKDLLPQGSHWDYLGNLEIVEELRGSLQ